MPAISKFRGIIVRVMNLPHRGLAIFANQGEQELVVDAGTLRIIAGSAPAGVMELVLEWAQAHETDLKRAQAASQSGRTPHRPVQLA